MEATDTKLPIKAIKEFKELYKKLYGINLKDAQAEFLAIRFLRLYQLIST
jgi:hypothetical protein